MKNYFSNIIDIKVEKNKALAPDDFNQILMILRRLKKILFTFKNLKYYDEFMFLQEH